jgi:hypothetical protein
MRLGNWIIDGFAGGAALYAMRDLWLYRNRSDDVGRGHRRSSFGLLLLLIMIPLSDLLNHVDLSTGVTWFVGIAALAVGTLGYRLLTKRGGGAGER